MQASYLTRSSRSPLSPPLPSNHPQTASSCLRASSITPPPSSLPSSPPRLATLKEIQSAAKRRNLEITLNTLGPFYCCVCRRGQREESGTQPSSSTPSPSSSSPSDANAADANKSSPESRTQQVKGGGGILAVSEGFILPWFGLMHCDTLQIFTRGIKGEEGEKVRGGVLGLGLLLGGAVLAHGWESGCKTAEILAINDDDDWHERLVRYYSYFGFKKVCKVGGNGLQDLPHLLVWGGEGTRMNANVEETLLRWTPALISVK